MAFNTWREWYICAILLAGLAASQTFPDLSECGKNAGCFRYPAGCTPAESCKSVLRWRMSNESNYVSFDMMALSDGWVAVGFSMDSRMGDDSVVDCIRNNSNNDTVKVGLSFNGYQKNTPYISNSTTQYVKGANASYVNGFIFCQFQRMISGDNMDIYSLNNSYYLLLGYGPAVAGVKQQHRMIPEVSPMHVNVVTDLVDISNPNMNPTQPPTVPTTLGVYSCSQLMNCVADGKGSQVTFTAIPGTNQVLINMTSILNGTSGWFGVGFSNDTTMNDDSVIDCIRLENGTITVKHSYNVFHNNTEIFPNATEGLANASLTYASGLLQCLFERQIDGLLNSQIFNLSKPYYLFLAQGPVTDTGMKRKHLQRFMTPYAITVTSNFSVPKVKSYFADGKGNYVAYKYLNDSDEMEFKMTGPVTEQGTWITLGFSNDTQMGSDSCLDCILLKNDTIIVQHSYNNESPKYNFALNSNEGITLIETNYQNGSLMCAFRRKVSSFADPRIFSLDKPYYLLLGKGLVDDNDNGRKQKHMETPVISTYPVDIRAVGNVTSGMETGTTTNSPTSTKTLAPSSNVSRFSDPVANNEVLFKLSEDGAHVNFTIRGPLKTDGWWIAVGFSDDNKMGNDSVMDCILLSNGTFRVQISYNPLNTGVKNEEVGNPDSAITDITATSDGSFMTCNFKRKISGFSDSRIFPLTQPYYLLLASGQLMADGKKSQHQNRVPSQSTFNLTASMGREEQGTTTPSNPLASTETLAPSSNVSRFSDPVANNEVLFKLSKDGTHVNFTIRGPLKPDGWWIAVGFSDDKIMGNDSVMDCILLSNGTFRVQISYNPLNTGVKNEEVGNPDSAITDITATSDGSFMTCSFKRKISGFSDSRIFPLTQPYYLLLASGQLMADGKKSQHQNRVPSQSTFNLTASMGREEQGMTTPSNPLASTETQAPFPEVSRFSDPVANTEVQFKLSEDGTRVNFTIRGPRTRDGWWIGVGFSDDKIMGNDSVLDCILLSNGTFRVQISYNTLRSDVKNEEVGNPDSAMSDITTTSDGSFMMCSLSRKISGFTDPRIFPFDKLYYLLLASGPVGDDGKKAQHLNRVPSSSTFNLTSLEGQNVSQDGRRHSNAPDPMRLLRAHGVLMITAFVMLLSGAIILARYYKTCWPENKICGTAVWFAAHRFLMVLGLFCCAAGFIIIFCYGDGFIYRSFSSGSPSYYWVHGPLGIVVMILIIINPIMAIFRCDPDHESRWIYNWMHFFVGMSCQILAGITLFFGIKMGELTYGLNHMAVFWLLIAFVGFHCFIEFILIIEKIVTQRHSNHSFTVNYGMTAPGEAPTAVKEGSAVPTRESLLFRYFVIALYALITMGLWLAMIILVGGSFHTT